MIHSFCFCALLSGLMVSVGFRPIIERTRDACLRFLRYLQYRNMKWKTSLHMSLSLDGNEFRTFSLRECVECDSSYCDLSRFNACILLRICQYRVLRRCCVQEPRVTAHFGGMGERYDGQETCVTFFYGSIMNYASQLGLCIIDACIVVHNDSEEGEGSSCCWYRRFGPYRHTDGS